MFCHFIHFHVILIRQKMELLDLSANRLNEQDVRIISSCLKNVKRLILINCSISSAGARIIADSLQWLSFPVRRFQQKIDVLKTNTQTF